MTEDQPSEALYGIVAQPEPTCPLINEALDSVERMQRKIRGYERADEDELRDMISDVETYLGLLSGYGRTGLLEDIRRRVTDIRSWGQEWKDLAKENVFPEVST